MDIIICENLKDLRRKKGNTQEELAGLLGISIQAVSKWERSEGYPDITLLPQIAAYYNVTVDDLLGVGEIKKQERIRKILDTQKINANLGDIEANIKLMREAIKEFPNDYQIIEGLMHSLHYCSKPEYLNEVIELGERIVSECTEDEIRYSALQSLCHSYPRDKAKKYARKLPCTGFTSNDVLNSILIGEELLVHTQGNLMSSVEGISLNVTWMLRAKEYSAEEAIHAYQTVIKFYELLFEDGDLGFYHCQIAFTYRDIAKLYAKLNNLEMTVKNLALSSKNAILFDNMKDHKLTALLVNAIEYKQKNNSQNWLGTHSKLVLDCLSLKCFDFCRDDECFKEIVTNLNNHLQ